MKVLQLQLHTKWTKSSSCVFFPSNLGFAELLMLYLKLSTKMHRCYQFCTCYNNGEFGFLLHIVTKCHKMSQQHHDKVISKRTPKKNFDDK
jgi:hypothetical protein